MVEILNKGGPMKLKEGLLTQTLLQQLFHYNNGILYWKKDISKEIKAGSLAGKLNLNTNQHIIKINGKGYLRARLVFFLHKGYWPMSLKHKDRISSNDKVENLKPKGKIKWEKLLKKRPIKLIMDKRHRFRFELFEGLKVLNTLKAGLKFVIKRLLMVNPKVFSEKELIKELYSFPYIPPISRGRIR